MIKTAETPTNDQNAGMEISDVSNELEQGSGINAEVIVDPEFRAVAQGFEDYYRGMPETDRIYGEGQWEAAGRIRDVIKEAVKPIGYFRTASRGLEFNPQALIDATNILLFTKQVMAEVNGGESGEFAELAFESSANTIFKRLEDLLPPGRVGNRELTKGQDIVPLKSFAVLTSLVRESGNYNYSTTKQLSSLMAKFGIEHYNFDEFLESTDHKTATDTLILAANAVAGNAISQGRKMNDQEILVWEKLGLLIGLNRDDVLDMANLWVMNDREKDQRAEKRQHNVRNNVVKLIELNNAGVDISKMTSRYGIRNFTRYKTETLLAQQEASYNPEGITLALTAESDWNGAIKSVEKNIDQSGWENPVYAEVGSLPDIARRLIYVTKTHGPVNRLFFEVHGSEIGMYPGMGKKRKNAITVDAILESRGIERLVERGLLSKDCEVILKSCNTGHEDGVGEAISEKTGLKTTAPPYESNALIVDPETGDVKSFKSVDTGDEADYGANVFVDGELVK